MPRHLAVDLGSWAIKLAVVEPVGKRLVVHDRATLRLDAGAEPATPEARFTALAALLKERPALLRVSSMIAGWPTERAALRRLTMPFTDLAQIEKTLAYTIEGEVPFDLDEMVLTWRAVSKTATDTRILYALAPKEDVADRLTELRKAGVDARVLLIDGEALGAYAPRERNVAVIDVGHTRTIVAFVREGVVMGSRAIDVGGRDLTAAIAAATGESWEDAEARKHGAVDEGVSVGSHDAWATWSRDVRKAVEAPIGQLLAEVRSTLLAFEDEAGIEFDEARVCGGGARFTRLLAFLEEDLGIPVQLLEDAAGGPTPPEFGLADGLGAVGGQTGLLDLRVGEFSFRGVGDLPRALLVYGSLGFSMLAMMIVLLGAGRYVMLRGQLAEADAAMRQLVIDAVPGIDPTVVRDSMTAKAVMQENLDSMRARADVLAQGDTPPVISKLRDLSNAVPPASETVLDATEIIIQPDNLSVSAETDGYGSASAVESRLQANPAFKNATKGADKKSKEKILFTITVPLGTDDAPAGEEG